LGEQWWQLRGWPVNWLIQLDPLVGLGTLLATGTLYAGLLWGLLTVILTILLGRFFCGWLCPFGALHQAVGWLANRGRKASVMIAANRYRRGQGIKFLILVLLFGTAAGDLYGRLLNTGRRLTGRGHRHCGCLAADRHRRSLYENHIRRSMGDRCCRCGRRLASPGPFHGWLRLLAASLQTVCWIPFPFFTGR
jgi:hypothetical protein